MRSIPRPSLFTAPALPFGSMRGSPRQSLVSWLCLICFGLTSNLWTSGLVLCEHADGSTRLEWSECLRGQDGSCLASCEGAESPREGQPLPCKDTPLKVNVLVAKACPRQATPTLLVPTLIVAILPCRHDFTLPRRMQVDVSARERPPDALACLRTVVLLV